MWRAPRHPPHNHFIFSHPSRVHFAWRPHQPMLTSALVILLGHPQCGETPDPSACTHVKNTCPARAPPAQRATRLPQSAHAPVSVISPEQTQHRVPMIHSPTSHSSHQPAKVTKHALSTEGMTYTQDHSFEFRRRVPPNS